MVGSIPQFWPAAAEIFVLVMTCVIMLVDLFLSHKQKVVTYLLTQLTLVVAFCITFSLLGNKAVTFNGQYINDQLSDLLKLGVYVVAFLVFWYARDYNKKASIRVGEFHILGLLSILGAMVLVSANSLLLLYIGLELLSLPLYAMVAISRRRAKGSEAGMKYFIMGALASGLLLYGMSLVYGMTGSLALNIIAKSLPLNHLVFVTGLVLMTVAITFKLGAIPFHLWAPDVYEGAPVSVTTYVATVPKLAAFGMLVRLIVFSMPQLKAEWMQLFMILGCLSLFGGNVMALVQTNIKRLLAYSTIANVGFFLIPLGMGNQLGLNAAIFYLFVYVITTAGVFGMILLMSKAGMDAEKVTDFKGLNSRNSWYAAMLMLLMFSMAGIPPLLGFDAKLMVIYHLMGQGYYELSTFMLIMSVVASFYYVRVVKVMYFDKPTDTSAVKPCWDMGAMVSLNSLFVLAAGLFPAALLVLLKV